MATKNPKAGEEFNELSIRLAEDTFALCNETYAATKKPPASKQLDELIRRAEAHIREYDSLVEQYTGGRLAAIKEAGLNVVRLREFTDVLKSVRDKAKMPG